MPTIFLAGDSTVQSYTRESYPQCGWGQFLSEYIELDKFTVSNHAIGGRSSRSFIEENRLMAIETSIKSGDFLLVQFGHNDASKDRPERYVSVSDFPYYLNQYVSVCTKKGATMILVTPIARSHYNDAHQIPISFRQYRESMLQFAKDRNISIIDLGLYSTNYLNNCSKKCVSDMYMPDKTHPTESGARVYASFVSDVFKNCL